MPTRERFPPNFPKFNHYSKVLPGEERVHQSILTQSNDLLEYPPDGSTTTIYELLLRAVNETNNAEFIVERDSAGCVQWIRYQKALRDAQRIGSALLQLGVGAGEASRVGISGLNSARYMITQYALISFSIVNVPLYYNYKVDALCGIINNCDIEVIFCDSLKRAETFIDCVIDGSISTLKKIIVMQSHSDIQNGPHERCPQIEIYHWDHMLMLGSDNMKAVTPPSPSSIYMICHTSGTTGTPKGVQLSHHALLASMAGLYVQWCVSPHLMRFDNNDVHLSFLSLAHIYEQLLQLFIIYVGGRVAVFGGDIKKLMNDVTFFKPTVIALVPLLLNRFRNAILDDVANQNIIKRFIFGIAYNWKLSALSQGKVRYNTLWDRLIFGKIHAKFGGNLRLITTGGAALSGEVMQFSRIVYGCPVFEGYGQTECCAAGTLSLPFDVGFGHVGGPAPWAQVKLVDVEELEYFSGNDVGEVCFKGACLMSGYFKDPGLTSTAIDKEGWLHTGDIGQWLPNGSLRIIDRKNNFFKLAQGDFVSPEYVGNVYLQHPTVKQIFVYGSPVHEYLVAVIVVNADLIRKYCNISAHQKDKLSESTSLIDSMNDDEVKRQFLMDLRKFAATKGLSGIEQLRNVHLTYEEFTAESGLLTPTLKIKRTVFFATFEKTIHHLYSQDLTV